MTFFHVGSFSTSPQVYWSLLLFIYTSSHRSWHSFANLNHLPTMQKTNENIKLRLTPSPRRPLSARTVNPPVHLRIVSHSRSVCSFARELTHYYPSLPASLFLVLHLLSHLTACFSISRQNERSLYRTWWATGGRFQWPPLLCQLTKWVCTTFTRKYCHSHSR